MTADFADSNGRQDLYQNRSPFPCSGPVRSRSQKANVARLLAAVNCRQNKLSKRRQIFNKKPREWSRVLIPTAPLQRTKEGIFRASYDSSSTHPLVVA